MGYFQVRCSPFGRFVFDPGLDSHREARLPAGRPWDDGTGFRTMSGQQVQLQQLTPILCFNGLEAEGEARSIGKLPRVALSGHTGF